MNFLSGLSGDISGHPDLKYIIDTVDDIFEYIYSDELIRMKIVDNKTYKIKVFTQFPDFAEKYNALMNIIVDGEQKSLENLVMMLNTICMVRTNKISMDTAFTNVREKLSDQYIYSKFGGKKEFEKVMNERHNKKV